MEVVESMFFSIKDLMTVFFYANLRIFLRFLSKFATECFVGPLPTWRAQISEYGKGVVRSPRHNHGSDSI